MAYHLGTLLTIFCLVALPSVLGQFMGGGNFGGGRRPGGMGGGMANGTRPTMGGMNNGTRPMMGGGGGMSNGTRPTIGGGMMNRTMGGGGGGMVRPGAGGSGTQKKGYDLCANLNNHKEWGEYCYVPGNMDAEQPAAEDFCQNSGMQMVSVHSQAENDFLVSWIGELSNTAAYWIGLKQTFENVYEWGDGSTYDFDKFEDEESSNSSESTVQECVTLSASGVWNHVNCTGYTLPYFCKTEIVITTTVKTTTTVAPADPIVAEAPAQPVADQPIEETGSTSDDGTGDNPDDDKGVNDADDGESGNVDYGDNPGVAAGDKPDYGTGDNPDDGTDDIPGDTKGDGDDYDGAGVNPDDGSDGGSEKEPKQDDNPTPDETGNEHSGEESKEESSEQGDGSSVISPSQWTAVMVIGVIAFVL